MNSMVRMSSSKSKFGKNPIFWTGQTRGQTSGQTGQKIDFVRVHGIKIINLKGVLGQDKLEDKIDFVQERTTYNPKRV